MNSSPYKAAVFQKYEFKKLCHLIGFTKEQIEGVLLNADVTYRSWSEDKLDKKGLVKTYKDGTIKKRTYRNPSVLLKTVQSRINKNIFSRVRFLPNVHGGTKKKSNITNAKEHQGNKYLFGTDLTDFYPNIKASQVYSALIKRGYSPHFAHWLTRLTTTNDEVPQGAPTSNSVSNLVFFETDIQLAAFCKENNITYTRYVDDLTFSSPQNFGPLIENILLLISNNKFKVNHRKTDYARYQLITGIKIFLFKIDGSDKIIEKAKEELLNDKPIKPVNNYLHNIRKTNKKK
ncbi:reverse transcriptase family protein [Flavitalea sp. BT771]|uniref:reverse transcriptase family protein n=1 Tax=Flavitalea sp. BT771 TaxID=3063329 RepID=UPI0026E21794|nr:reverse transcriptase family protein [Flavitalea sp. BT771]MDO6434799.1 reverse transcriptase family protein [Flavitalea sp. BT771]MDV6223699.1 reverse transcriptase family protein [Flavitalea sp. BT771]